MYLHEVYFKGSSVIRPNVICDVRVDLTFEDVRACQIYLQSILSLQATTFVSTSCFVASQPRKSEHISPSFTEHLGSPCPLTSFPQADGEQSGQGGE